MTETEGQKYRRRLQTLADEFGKMEGFVDMDDWVRVPFFHDQEMREEFEANAKANPCGTAACMAGKAGLMEVFKEEGFEWTLVTRFSMHPGSFFGDLADRSLFTGAWAIENIHTPRHAQLAIEDFLESLDSQSLVPAHRWVPSAKVEEEIKSTKPKFKKFPVNGTLLGWDALHKDYFFVSADEQEPSDEGEEPMSKGNACQAPYEAFHVKWEIEVYAANAVDAAKQAREHQTSGGSLATVFDVTPMGDTEGGSDRETIRVDLTEIEDLENEIP